MMFFDTGLFQRNGEFPASEDPEFPVSRIASDYWPVVSSEVSSVLDDRLCTARDRFIVATLAIVFPAFGFAPRLYEWLIHQRIRRLYRRLRGVEIALQRELSASQIKELEDELAGIDRAARAVPVRHSDLYYML